jgi:hypothetical protein
MDAVVVICPSCDADVMIYPAPVNQCPFCSCLFKLIRKDDFEDDQIYTTVLLKSRTNQKGKT